MMPTLEEKMGIKFPENLESPEMEKFLCELIIKHKVECKPPRTISRMIDKLVFYLLN